MLDRARSIQQIPLPARGHGLPPEPIHLFIVIRNAANQMSKFTKTKAREMRHKEKRSIHKHWLQRYFFYQNENILTCLICKKIIRVAKKYNIQRHYETYHEDYDQFSGEVRKEKVSELMNIIMEELKNAEIDVTSDFVCVVPKQENEDSYTINSEQQESDIFVKEENINFQYPSSDSEFKLFGQYIGEKLLALKPELQSWAKREISEIIFNAEMKQIREEIKNSKERNNIDT